MTATAEGAGGGGGASGGFVARTLSSLRSRNFRLFFIGQTISNTGNWLTLVALTLLVLGRAGTGLAVGVLTACQFGPILVLSPWAGLLVDRVSKHRLLITTQLLELGQSCSLAALAFLPHAPLWAFYVSAFFGGCFLAFDNPVRRAFVNEMVPPDDIPNAVTIYSAMVNISRVGGPALAGLLITTVGYGWAFTIDAVSYASVLVALAMMRPAELRRAPAAPRGPGQLRAGFRYIADRPHLWGTYLMLAVIGTLSYNFGVVLPLLVEKGLGGSDGAFTVVYSISSAGALAGAVLIARRRHVGIRTVSAGAAFLGVSLVLLAGVPNLVAAAVVAALMGVASVAYMTATTALAQVGTEQHMIGRVLAIQTVLLIGTSAVGGPILGAISDLGGPRSAVLVGAVAALLAAAFGFTLARRTPAEPAS